MHKLSQFFLIESNRSNLLKMAISLCLLLVMTACIGAGNGSMNKVLSARVLYSSFDCGIMKEGEGLSIISTEEEFVKNSPGLASKTSAGNLDTLFTREQVIQINMGRQSSGGYALKLIEDKLVVEEGWATIKVQWVTPAKGMMTTQALTSPCLLVAMPKRELTGVRVVDQTGKIRLQSEL